jgi:hypothetical protein
MNAIMDTVWYCILLWILYQYCNINTAYNVDAVWNYGCCGLYRVVSMLYELYLGLLSFLGCCIITFVCAVYLYLMMLYSFLMDIRKCCMGTLDAVCRCCIDIWIWMP